MSEYIFRNFELYYPHLAEQAEDWYLNKYGDLIVTLENGELVAFDTFTDQCRRLPIDEFSEEEYKREFGIRFNRLMLFKHVSQEELSRELNISQATISNYIRGKSLPNIYVMDKILKILDCSMYDFDLYEKE